MRSDSYTGTHVTRWQGLTGCSHACISRSDHIVDLWCTDIMDCQEPAAEPPPRPASVDEQAAAVMTIAAHVLGRLELPSSSTATLVLSSSSAATLVPSSSSPAALVPPLSSPAALDPQLSFPAAFEQPSSSAMYMAAMLCTRMIPDAAFQEVAPKAPEIALSMDKQASHGHDGGGGGA